MSVWFEGSAGAEPSTAQSHSWSSEEANTRLCGDCASSTWRDPARQPAQPHCMTSKQQSKHTKYERQGHQKPEVRAQIIFQFAITNPEANHEISEVGCNQSILK